MKVVFILDAFDGRFRAMVDSMETAIEWIKLNNPFDYRGSVNQWTDDNWTRYTHIYKEDDDTIVEVLWNEGDLDNVEVAYLIQENVEVITMESLRI